MKNREKYKDKLIEACKKDQTKTFFNEHIQPFYKCRTWDFMSHDIITILTMFWLEEEYKEEPEVDWSKVEVDTPILVSMNEEDWGYWSRRHFAEYRDGAVYAFKDGATSWTTKLKTEWPYAKLAEPQE